VSSNEQGIEGVIKFIALKNAAEYNGKARVETVIAKAFAARQDLRGSVKSLLPKIKAIVHDINLLSSVEQQALLEEIAPDEEKKVEVQSHQRSTSIQKLPPLPSAVLGQVVTRFPPEPNGYPHIGHAKAAIIDEEYARMYNGKLILRFDDTNPLNEKEEYYDAILEGLEWLRVRPNIVKNTSDDILKLHELGKKLVQLDGAYVCTCSQTTIHDLRSKGLPCQCRADSNTSLELLQKMFDGSFDKNAAIIRFKGEMADQNTAMRDPTLFRIIDADHPKLGTRIRVWPTYDFASPIEDSLDGVSHAMRTKEYELRNELYFEILDRLGLQKPFMMEFSRLELDGIPVSKRKIKPLVENGMVKSWDDPRLPTLMGFKRRGFLPESIREFVLTLGLTLAETKPPFEALEALNRKRLDPQSMRLFFVKNPVELCVQNGIPKEVILKNHPNSELGIRRLRVSSSFFIPQEDAEKFSIGDEFRLIELYNLKLVEKQSKNNKLVLVATVTGDEVRQNMPKIQWVAKNDIVPYQVIIPKHLYVGEEYNTKSLEIAEGFAESFVSTLQPDTRIQFVRFGFCRIDGNHKAIFTHK